MQANLISQQLIIINVAICPRLVDQRPHRGRNMLRIYTGCTTKSLCGWRGPLSYHSKIALNACMAGTCTGRPQTEGTPYPQNACLADMSSQTTWRSTTTHRSREQHLTQCTKPKQFINLPIVTCCLLIRSAVFFSGTGKGSQPSYEICGLNSTPTPPLSFPDPPSAPKHRSNRASRHAGRA